MKLPSQDQDTSTNGDGFEDDIKSKLEAALERFFNQSKESLTELEKVTLTSIVAEIATDIATNGFFNPSSIADSIPINWLLHLFNLLMTQAYLHLKY